MGRAVPGGLLSILYLNFQCSQLVRIPTSTHLAQRKAYLSSNRICNPGIFVCAPWSYKTYFLTCYTNLPALFKICQECMKNILPCFEPWWPRNQAVKMPLFLNYSLRQTTLSRLSDQHISRSIYHLHFPSGSNRCCLWPPSVHRCRFLLDIEIL